MRDGFLYSGVQGGDIVRIPLADVTSKPWQVVTKIGLPCDDLSQESTCGRPLGMEFDLKGNNKQNKLGSGLNRWLTNISEAGSRLEIRRRGEY